MVDMETLAAAFLKRAAEGVSSYSTEYSAFACSTDSESVALRTSDAPHREPVGYGAAERGVEQLHS